MPAGRSAHCSTISGSKLYIFGGVGTQGYCNSDLWIVELNQEKIKQEEGNRKGFLHNFKQLR